MGNPEERRRSYRPHDPARVMALSDGVFAIVITLLVLELHVPDLSRGQRLAEALSEIRPSFVAFLISFVVVAIAWAGHRDLFAFIRLTDRTLVWLNVLYLFPLTLLPFGAALIARYAQDRVALILYGALLVGAALTRLFIWLYATSRPHLLFEPIGPRARTLGVLVMAGPAALYVFAILIAGTAPSASLWIYAGAPVLYFLALAFGGRRLPPGTAEGEVD